MTGELVYSFGRDQHMASLNCSVVPSTVAAETPTQLLMSHFAPHCKPLGFCHNEIAIRVFFFFFKGRGLFSDQWHRVTVGGSRYT